MSDKIPAVDNNSNQDDLVEEVSDLQMLKQLIIAGPLFLAVTAVVGCFLVFLASLFPH